MVKKEGQLQKRIHKEEYDGTDISEPGVIVIEVADVLRIVGEMRKANPIKPFEYQEPRNWNLLQYKNHYESLAHQMLEVIHYLREWLGEDQQ